MQHAPTHDTDSTVPNSTLQLFNRNFSTVIEAAFAPGLLAEDSDRLIHATARRLSEYIGPPDNDAAFCDWITAHLHPAAERLSRFYAMRADHTKVVRKAIWKVIKNCSSLGVYVSECDLFDDDDNPIVGKDGNPIDDRLGTVAEIESKTWEFVFKNLDNFLLPGVPAAQGRPIPKLSTRLFAAAKAQALGWRQERLRWRRRYMELDVHLDSVAKAERRIDAGLPATPRTPRTQFEAETQLELEQVFNTEAEDEAESVVAPEAEIAA